MAHNRNSSKFPADSPDLIIFDCDSVLVDSEIISIAVDEIVLADLGWQLNKDEIIQRFVGRSHDHFMTVVQEHIGFKPQDHWEDKYQHLYREELLHESNLSLPACMSSTTCPNSRFCWRK